MKGKKLKILLIVLLTFLLFFPFYGIAATTYTVTLKKDGGSGGQDKVTGVRKGHSMPELSSLPSKSGNIFQGYYSGKDCTGEIYYNSKGKSARNYEKDKNMKLYACWQKESESPPTDNYLPSFYDHLPGYTHPNGKLEYFKESTNLEISESDINSADPISGGYGIYIKLIQYDPESKTETVRGTPILIYSGHLLDDIKTKQPPKGDGSIAQSGASKLCYSIYGGCSDEFCEEHGLIRVNIPALVESIIASRVTLDSELSSFNQWVFDTTELMNTEMGIYNVNCVKTGFKNFYEEVYYYDSEDISYATGNPSVSRPKLINAGQNLKQVELYNYIISCMSSEDCKFGLSSPITKDKLENAFQYHDINERNLDSYYLSFEPVIREVTGKNKKKSTQNNQSKISTKGREAWYFSCNAGDKDGCTSGKVKLYSNHFEETGDFTENGTKYICTTYEHKRRKCNDCSAGETDYCDGTTKCWSSMSSVTDCHDNKISYEYGERTETPVMWKGEGCAEYRTDIYTYLTTVNTHYYTKIKPARTVDSAGANKMLSDLVTAQNSLTLHENEELDINNNKEYYVGPELETALAGECGSLGSRAATQCKKENKYSLYYSSIKNPNGSSFEYKYSNAGKAAIGVLYLWYPEITGCNTICKNTTGDARLACAENFCDNLYYFEEDDEGNNTSQTQVLKEMCLYDCKVRKTPNNCRSKLNNLEFIRDIMKDSPNNITNSKAVYDYTSTCNKGSVSKTSDENKGYKAYCMMDSTDIDILDQMQFVNVMCVESTSCGFPDVSKFKLTKGRKIDYDSRTHIEKKCKVWFDVDSWKYYYASVPRNDKFDLTEKDSSNRTVVNTYDTRDRLLKIIDWYNSAASRGFDKSISQDITKTGSTLTWEDLDYDISNLKVKTIINENYVGSTSSSHTDYELTVKKGTVDSELNNVTNTTSIEHSKSSSDPTKTPTVAHSFQRYSPVEKGTNTYGASSSYDASYEIPKMYCVAVNGDVSENTEASGRCSDGTMAVHAYYASLHSTGIDFNTLCTNGVSVQGSTSIRYFSSQDDCQVPVGASCTIIVQGPQQCGQYNGPVNVRMQMFINNTVVNKLDTNSYGLNVGSLAYNRQDVIKGYNPHPGGTVTFYGGFKLTDGKVISCQKTITINECQVGGCKIEKDNDYNSANKTRYLVTDGNGTYYAKTSNSSSGFLKLGVESGTHVFYATKPNTEEKGKTASGYDVIGKVVNGSSCKLCCKASENPPGPPDDIIPERCDPDKKATDTYCSKYFRQDPNHFDSSDECLTYYYYSCCPSYNEAAGDKDKLEAWCSDPDNLEANNFESANSCVNVCCQDQEKCVVSDNITYRPVSRENPFPNSEVSKKLNYPEGDRLIGRNWINMYENITTTETGASSVYDELEYEIELNPKKIRDIKRDNKKSDTVYYDYKDATKMESSEIDIDISGCNNEEHPGHHYDGYCSYFVQKYTKIVRGAPNSNYKHG